MEESKRRGRKPGQKNTQILDEHLVICYHMAVVNLPKRLREVFADYYGYSNTFHTYFTSFQKYLSSPELAEFNLSKNSNKKRIFNEQKEQFQNESERYKNSFELVTGIYSELFPELTYEILNNHFKRIYPLAFKRYESISKRSFERNLKELFFQNYYIVNEFNFKTLGEDINETTKKDLDKYNKSIIDKNLFLPVSSDVEKPIDLSLKVESEFHEFYRDMTQVQTFNTIFDYWVKEKLKNKKLDHSKRPYTELSKHAFKYFNSVLSIEEFCKNFFGKDSHNRCCKYCEISETEIDELLLADNIFTKRIYSRGKTMEVDQRDAFKGYTLDNIDLVCYWCNNAKTDEFSEEEFLSVGKAFKKVWESRLQNIDKKIAA